MLCNITLEWMDAEGSPRETSRYVSRVPVAGEVLWTGTVRLRVRAVELETFEEEEIAQWRSVATAFCEAISTEEVL